MAANLARISHQGHGLRRCPGVRSARSGPKSVAQPTLEARDAAGERLGATRRAVLSGCPVEAIWYEDDLPPRSAGFTAVNAEFFGDTVTGWGEPGGLGPDFRTGQDHPVVAAWDSNGG